MTHDADRQTLTDLLQTIGARPLLSDAQMRQLAVRRDAGDPSAVGTMVEHNMRWGVKLARKYANGMPLLDAVQEAALGLMKAAERFDPDRGKFSTLATWWVRHQLDEARSHYSDGMRLPRHRYQDVGRVRGEQQRRRDQGLPEPTAADIAELLDVGQEVAAGLLILCQPVARLDAPVRRTSGEDGILRADLLAAEDCTEQIIEHRDRQQQVAALLGCLQDREARLLRMRYGFDDGVPATLEQIGRQMDLSKERVRVLERRAIKRLRETAVAA